MTTRSRTIFSKTLLNPDGSRSTVAELVAEMQRDGVRQVLIDRWLLGLELTMTLKANRQKVSHEPRDINMLSAHVHQVLHAASFTKGQHHRGSGWSDWGDLVYEPAQPGYIVKRRQTGYDDRHCPVYGLFVDHAGRGRKAALPAYAAALKAAGFTVEIRPVHDLMTKTIIWVT